MTALPKRNNFILIRKETSSEGTFGTLTNGDFSCFTCELPFFAGDPSVHNERRTDCIPPGEYKCEVVRSPKFGSVYMVKGVPDRSHILIHAGNTVDDIEGCILLGTAMGRVKSKKAVLNSRAAIISFMDYMENKPFNLLIQQPESWK